MPWEIAIAAFGITAAILLIGGAILLRYQRDRQHFLLMKAALDKGINSFPGMVPGWLISLRIGALCLILGLGLMGGGIAFYNAASFIDEPPVQSAVSAPPGYRSAGDTSDAPPPPPPPRGNPGSRPDDGRPPPPGPPPPRPGSQSPAMERWHLIQTQHTIGLIAICVGAILALLGLVRIAFARIERRYTSDPIPAPRSSTTGTGNIPGG